MQIALYHSHYEEDHLEAVATEMKTLGAPEIKCIWSECYGMWLAVEGCHRLRAAQLLDITPQISEIDLEDNETTTIQIDGEDVEVNTIELAIEVTDAAWQATILEF